MLHKHDKCRGITLFRWFRLNIELWYCPPNYSIRMHRHAHFDGEVLLLVASCWVRKYSSKAPDTIRESDSLFTWFSVPRNVVHWVDTKGSKWIPTIFINVEKWTVKPTTAADDFVSQ